VASADEPSVGSRTEAAPAPLPFFHEVWRQFRPYGVCFVVDLLLGTCLHLGQKYSWLLGVLIPLPETSAKVTEYVHQVGTIGAFGIFTGFFLKDLIKISRDGGG
jgi:hypothetical protein